MAARQGKKVGTIRPWKGVLWAIGQSGMLEKYVRSTLASASRLDMRQGGRSHLCAQFHRRDKELEGRRGNVLWARDRWVRGFGLMLSRASSGTRATESISLRTAHASQSRPPFKVS
jgi:hypothetical protein